MARGNRRQTNEDPDLTPDDNPETTPEDGPEAPEAVEDAPDVAEDAPAPEEAPEAAPDEVTGYWTTDQYGNPTENAKPARAFVVGTEFYPFEYEDSPNPAEVIATEDVYSVIRYPGSDRRGSSLLYNKGARVPRGALNNITDDMSGRWGPLKTAEESSE
jgi:hypothetical protein